MLKPEELRVGDLLRGYFSSCLAIVIKVNTDRSCDTVWLTGNKNDLSGSHWLFDELRLWDKI